MEGTGLGLSGLGGPGLRAPAVTEGDPGSEFLPFGLIFSRIERSPVPSDFSGFEPTWEGMKFIEAVHGSKQVSGEQREDFLAHIGMSRSQQEQLMALNGDFPKGLSHFFPEFGSLSACGTDPGLESALEQWPAFRSREKDTETKAGGVLDQLLDRNPIGHFECLPGEAEEIFFQPEHIFFESHGSQVPPGGDGCHHGIVHGAEDADVHFSILQVQSRMEPDGGATWRIHFNFFRQIAEIPALDGVFFVLADDLEDFFFLE